MDGSKVCQKCGKEKSLDLFYKDKFNPDGKQRRCKDCVREHYQEHRLAKLKYAEIRRKTNRGEISAYLKAYRVRRKPALDEYKKQWDKKNRERLRRYTNKRRKEPKHRLAHAVGTAIWASLKGDKGGRHWEDLVGYTKEELSIHLEGLFANGMSWDNYGKWHIDHIKPISKFSFTASKDKGFEQCWALSNLRPLWARDNLVKGNRYEDV